MDRGNRRGYNDTTPLYHAVRKGQAAIAEVLVRHGADVKARDNEGKTALAWALGKTPASFIGTAPSMPAMVIVLRKRGATESRRRRLT